MRLRAAIAAGAVVGGGIAAYLTYVHYAHTSPICTNGGCEKVQRSSYAALDGIPVALLGLIGYALVLASAGRREAWSALAGAFVAIAGVAFSAYLLWAQLARIHAVCQWCLANDIVITALAVLCVWRALEEPDP